MHIIIILSFIAVTLVFFCVVDGFTVPFNKDIHSHTTTQHYRLRSTISHHNNLESHIDDERYPAGEVVGSTGKIGSYILHRLNEQVVCDDDTNDGIEYPQSLNVAAVPRGLAPGCLSPNGTPIYAAVPSSSIQSVWKATLPHRREDLVFMCNCIPSRHLIFDSDDEEKEVSVAILHFGVSHNNTDIEMGRSLVPIPKLNNSPDSPPTVIYGKHANTLGLGLGQDGIPVQIVTDPQEIQIAAAKKIAWSSLLWLCCHSFDDGNGPITVKDVHHFKSKQLQRLVEEILPSLEILASESWTNNIKLRSDVPSSQSIGPVQDILGYLEKYSMSISNGNVIPSKRLAMREINERNGLLLSRDSYHMELIRRVAGEDVLTDCLQSNANARVDTNLGSSLDNNSSKERFQRIKCTSSDLEFLFNTYQSTSTDQQSTTKSVIVVGAGMVGSSIAYHLSKHGAVVTVIDQRTNLLPSSENNGKGNDNTIDPGTATSSSFAWLNANDKSPLSYKQFNCLGMEIWRRHDVLKNLPIWCGALIRTASTPITSPYYSCFGPLNAEDASRLEPGVKIPQSDKSEMYFYPEEGHVDPVEAVKALRSSAHRNGVIFFEGTTVSKLVRDDTGKVVGVEYNKADNADETLLADFVVIAAGAKSDDPNLGVGPDHLKLLNQPGVLAYARTNDDDQSLQRIFVDTISQSHILHRPDNTIVIGGGELVVGGTDTESVLSSSQHLVEDEDTKIGNEMIKNTHLNEVELVGISHANRPIPHDGFPAIGFANEDVYVAVSHSGITLGPLIGELAAYEILNASACIGQYGFTILNKYRPSISRTRSCG